MSSIPTTRSESEPSRLIAIGAPAAQDRAFSEVLGTPEKASRNSAGRRTYVVLRNADVDRIMDDGFARSCLIWDAASVKPVRRVLLQLKLGSRVAERLTRRSWLSADEAVDVLQAPNRDELFLGIEVDQDDRKTLLTRGDLTQLVVPFDWYEQSQSPVRPNFSKAGIDDCGQTVRLGAFEAAADAILYEHDPAYRKRVKKGRVALDDSLGGALRRLRLDRGLARGDFAPISEKTIARIERNESPKPRGSTLAHIAKRLGVTVKGLESY